MLSIMTTNSQPFQMQMQRVLYPQAKVFAIHQNTPHLQFLHVNVTPHTLTLNPYKSAELVTIIDQGTNTFKNSTGKGTKGINK